MIDFIMGFVTGVFIMLLFIQVMTKRTITLNGAVPKSENPSRFRRYTLLYVIGCIASVLVIMYT
jgi:formate hydrogenlyase subunit 6/NADH:ubiquinone oxidoreductase subunit I